MAKAYRKQIEIKLQKKWSGIVLYRFNLPSPRSRKSSGVFGIELPWQPYRNGRQ